MDYVPSKSASYGLTAADVELAKIRKASKRFGLLVMLLVFFVLGLYLLAMIS